MKQVILLSILILFCRNGLKAQILDLPEMPKTTKQPLASVPVENHIKSNLFIIRLDYQIKDKSTGKDSHSDRDANPDFGTVYNFGIKTSGGYYTNSRAIFTWLYDTNFTPSGSTKQYSLAISGTSYRDWNGKEYRKPDFPIGNIPMSSDSIFFIRNKAFHGLEPVADAEAKKGWFVWIVQTSKDKKDVFSLEFFPAGQNGKRKIPDKSVSDRIIIGGLYVTQSTSNPKQANLSGLLYKNNNKWFVKHIPVEDDHSEEKAIVTNDKKD
ncbi:MAG: hypothetical protein LBD80_06775 [Tannerella sp.]|jgi:hypothetical protein|nr:hypothetical protein [Tannerella sp.]